jgi:hypothetical protein
MTPRLATRENMGGCRRRGWLWLAVGLALACAGAPSEVSRHTLPELAPGDTDPALGFEALPERHAAELLPADVVVGPHHRVLDPVGSDGFLHLYRLEGEPGELEVAGDELLRERVRELGALGALRSVQDAEFTAAVRRAEAERPFIGRWKLGSLPATTALGMPEAAWNQLLAIDATSSAERSADAHAALREYLRFDTEKRALAAHLGVDAHTRFRPLQRELNRVAIAVFAGGFPRERVPAGEEGEKGVERPFADEDLRLAMLLGADAPEDLVRWNRIELAALGVPPELAARLLAQPWLTDRHRTILIAALAALEGVENRAALVEAALNARSETDALVYQRIAELLRGIHERVAPIERLATDGRFVRAYLAGGVRITPIEVDELFWTRPTARLVEAGAGPDPTGAALVRRELWLTGAASPRTRRELEARGLVLVEHAFAHLDALEPSR